MGGWTFLIVVSTLIVMPIYRGVMRRLAGNDKLYVFMGVAVLSSAVCFLLLKDDPRGVAGPGYVVIFLFGPFAIGWVCNGIFSLVGWAIAKAIGASSSN